MSTATTTDTNAGLRRVTGWLLVVGAVTFAVAATVLSSTFEWPDILREPPQVVLPAFVAGGTSPVWTWFAVAWTYAILLIPILLLPAALGRRDDPVLRAATFVGAASVLLALIGFLRWCSSSPRWPAATPPGIPPPRRRWRPPGWPSTSSAGRCWASTWASCWPSPGPSPSVCSCSAASSGAGSAGQGWWPASCTCSTRATSWPPPSPGSPSSTSPASSAAPCGACG